MDKETTEHGKLISRIEYLEQRIERISKTNSTISEFLDLHKHTAIIGKAYVKKKDLEVFDW